ncbi:MAG: ATP-binding protein, partial [Anaerostipes sp.]|nr:ATP-binding protein [Anaerostipes sp.]
AEVQRHTIELLRQPLEERQIVIARVSGTCIFPASFMLVGAMNEGTRLLIQRNRPMVA